MMLMPLELELEVEVGLERPERALEPALPRE
jgi:hypothetical protein